MYRTATILLLLALIPVALAQAPVDPNDPLGLGEDPEPAEQAPDLAPGQSGDDPAGGVTDPVQGNDGGIDWGRGIVWGVGIGGVGLAALAGIAYYLGIGGLRHVDKHNVLEHPMRKSLLEVVESEPGVHLRELATRHGTAVTNTQWHLRKLEMAGLVKTQKVQGRRLYYPTAGGAQAKQVAVQNAAVQNPNARRILDYLQTRPGTNQRSLAEALEMNPGTVRWHLRKMEAAGMVKCIPDGTQSCYFPLDTTGPGTWSDDSDSKKEAILSVDGPRN